MRSKSVIGVRRSHVRSRNMAHGTSDVATALRYSNAAKKIQRFVRSRVADMLVDARPLVDIGPQALSNRFFKAGRALERSGARYQSLGERAKLGFAKWHRRTLESRRMPVDSYLGKRSGGQISGYFRQVKIPRY